MILAKNDLLKKRYLEILKSVYENVLDENALAAAIKKQHDLIQEAVKEDKLMEYSYEEFEKNSSTTLGDKLDPGAYYPGLLEFVHDRHESVAKQLSAFGNEK